MASRWDDDSLRDPNPSREAAERLDRGNAAFREYYRTGDPTPLQEFGLDLPDKTTQSCVKESNVHRLSADIERLLHFFDEKPDWSIGHATGVVGIVGEDLNCACFQHYLRSRNGTAVVLRNSDSGKPLPVNPGGKKGPRLDRWVQVTWPCGSTTVFQTEIKSWSAHGFGGIRLPLSASPEEVTGHRQDRWSVFWDSENKRLKHPLTEKVLERMSPPKGVNPESVRPLLIFWEALGPGDKPAHCLFRVDVASPEFRELWVFSVSSYLRTLLAKKVFRIELEMPEVALRIRSLNRMFLS